MVEKASRQSGKDSYCNFTFETLNVQGASYRVPVLDSSNAGKFISKGPTRKETNNDNAQASNRRDN